MDFTRKARVLYPSYVEQWEEGKIARVRLIDPRGAPIRVGGIEAVFNPVTHLRAGALRVPAQPGEDLSPVLRVLLGHFFADDRLDLKDKRAPFDLQGFLDGFREIQDDRLYVNVAYALAGPPAPDEEMRRLFSLALFVDRPRDVFQEFGGYAYDARWLEPALEAASLGLWDRSGLYAGFSDMSNAYLGAGEYFCATVAPRHVPYSYERMLIQALFYQAALRRYNREIAEATGSLTKERTGFQVLRAPDQAFQALRGHFIEFTNRYWFREVTPHLQGRRMFAFQQEALGLKEEYAEIKEEMERADEFIEAQRNRTLGHWALLVACIALWITLLPVFPLDDGIGWPSWDGFSIYPRRLLYIGLLAIAPLLVLALLVVAVVAVKWVAGRFRSRR